MQLLVIIKKVIGDPDCEIFTEEEKGIVRITQTAEGDMLVWELLFPKDSEHGMRFPFFIDWLECANPKDTNPVGGQFQNIEVTTPEGAKLQALMQSIDLDITVKSGDPQIAVVVESEKGEVVLTSSKESSQLILKI